MSDWNRFFQHQFTPNIRSISAGCSSSLPFSPSPPEALVCGPERERMAVWEGWGGGGGAGGGCGRDVGGEVGGGRGGRSVVFTPDLALKYMSVCGSVSDLSFCLKEFCWGFHIISFSSAFQAVFCRLPDVIPAVGYRGCRN